MTKKIENKSNDNDNKKKEFELPISGIKVKMDVSLANGHLLMKARTASDGGVETGIFVLAEICLFDGEKYTAHDILDLDMEDVTTLEEEYINVKKQMLVRKK